MTPADYDAWYAPPRGCWIGETEYALAARLLAAQPGDSLLDVGCGTGWVTRRAPPDRPAAPRPPPQAPRRGPPPRSSRLSPRRAASRRAASAYSVSPTQRPRGV